MSKEYWITTLSGKVVTVSKSEVSFIVRREAVKIRIKKYLSGDFTTANFYDVNGQIIASIDHFK